MPETNHAFVEMIARLGARIEVRESDPPNHPKTLRETIAFLRQQREKFKQDPLIKSLTTEIISPSENVIALLSNIVEQVRAENTSIPDLGILLMGSNALGGAELGRLMHRQDTPDLDYALIVPDFGTYLEHGKQICQKIRELVDQEKQKFGLEEDFHVCERLAGLPTYSFNSTAEARNFLLENYASPFTKYYKITFCFFPSVPAEINQKNQKFILSALNQIYRKKPDVWNTIRTDLLKEWRKFHKLDSKYFGPIWERPAYSRSEVRLAEKIDRASPLAMSEPFAQLIESTKTNQFPKNNEELISDRLQSILYSIRRRLFSRKKHDQR